MYCRKVGEFKRCQVDCYNERRSARWKGYFKDLLNVELEIYERSKVKKTGILERLCRGKPEWGKTGKNINQSMKDGEKTEIGYVTGDKGKGI